MVAEPRKSSVSMVCDVLLFDFMEVWSYPNYIVYP